MNTKSTHRSLLLGTALASGLICVVAVPQARAQVLPTGSVVVSGDAVVGPVSGGDTVTIDLNASTSVINWNTFSIGNGDTVNFISTNAGASNTVNTTQVAVLNRVTGFNPVTATQGNIQRSLINGTLNSSNSGNNNIAVWLVNPAGITYSGNGASFNGGSLILSTLEVPDAEFLAAGSTTFSAFTGPATLAGGSTQAVSIADGLSTRGDLLVIGRAITLDNTINVGVAGDRRLGSFVVADSVTFPAGVGSPMTFTVNTGSALAGGIQVVGSATIEGSSLSLVAVSQAVAVATLLQVSAGAELTATATNGVITLATKSIGTATVTAPNANDRVNYAAGSGSNRGLIASGTNGAVQLASAGALTIDGVLDINGGTRSLTADAATINLANTSVTTGGTQSYTGAITANGNRTLIGSTVTLAGSYDGDVAGRNLTITGNAVLNGTVGAAFALGTLDVSGTSAINGASITTTGNQTFTGNATLGAGLHTLTAPLVTFGGTLDGPGGLAVSADASFGGAIGATSRLASLAVPGAISLTAPTVRTVGDQTFGSNMTLGADTTFDSTSGLVRFQGTVNSDGTERSLTVTGNAWFDDVVGGGAQLSSVLVSGTSAINGGAITTSGNQTYTGTATIDTATTTFTGGTVRFGGTLEGTIADTNALVVSGNARFDGSVGTTTRLTTIDVSGTTAINGAAINTQGNQTYTDAATLGAGLHTLTAALVTFSSTLDGPGGLALSNDGIFTGAVGSTVRLASLLAPGAITLGTPTVRTTGDQTYGAAMVLDTNRTFDSTSGTVRFQSTVDSDGTPRQLTVTGAARFDSAVGATNALSSLSVSGASALNGATVRTDAGQTYTGPATLGADTTLTNVTSGTVSFGSTVNSDGTARSLNIAGDTSITGAVGGTAALSAMTVNAPATITTAAITANGTIALDAGTSIVTGALTANGATSDVLINQAIAVPGTAQVGGANVGRDFRLRATTVDLAGTQGAVGVYDITSTTGAITGAASLAVTAGTIVLDSFSTIDLNIASSLNAGAGDVRLRNADLANVALGNVTAGALVAADSLVAGHGALVGALGSVAGTRITDLTAGNVNVPNTAIAALGNIRLTSVSGTTVNLAGTNITGLVGAPGGFSDLAVGRFAVTATGNVDINANGLVQAAAISGAAVSINGGNIAASGIGGAVDVNSITATGGLIVTAFDDNPAAGIPGFINIGSTDVTGTTSISNTLGVSGNIRIGNKLVGTGDINVNSALQVLLATFNAGADSGLIRSTGGNITINAAASVLALGQISNISPATGGFDSFAATGNLTVNSTGDVEVGSLSAGGNLALAIGGALLGSTAVAGTAIPGGALFANGATGQITVNAATGLNPINEIVSLARVEATGNATLRGDQVAVGVVQVGGTLAIENPLLVALTAADFYVGQRTFVGDATLNLGGGLAFTNLVTAENIAVGNIYNTETLFAGRTAANLSSGAGGAITGTVAAGAQLGTITAGGLINLSTGALVARTVNSGTSTRLATTIGTNSVHTAVAGTSLSLIKSAGAIGALGDELRLVSGTANGGNASAQSNTQTRVGTITSTGGNTLVTGQGDVSGLRLFGQSAVAVFNTVTDVSNPTRLNTNYGAANLISNTDFAGGQSFNASVQLGTVSGQNTTNLSGGVGRAVVIDSVSATAGAVIINASVGTLRVGSVNALTTAAITKSGGNLTVDGDDLRIGTLSTGGNVTINSGTHLRVGAGGITSTGGSIGATAGGDISGFRTALTSDPAYTASEIRLGDIAASTATTSDGAFSTRYGAASFTANNAAGNLTLTANSGSVQANGLSAGNNLTVNARAMTITNAAANAGALSLTAAIGTLHLGTGSSALLATITKNGGSPITDGDEMRLGGLTLAAGATIGSSTHIRLNTITANGGSVSLTAGGDVSGFKSAALGLAAGEIPLPTVSARTATETGLVLGTRFGLGSIQATGAGADISVTAATGGVQLATVAANRDVSVSARALALGTATATNGFLTLTATQGTLALNSGSAGRAAFLTKQLGSAATDGDELRVGTLTGGTGVTLDSSTHVRAGTVTATTGNLTVTAGGDVSGLKVAAIAHPSPAFPGNVTIGTQLDSRYGDASLTASTGNLQVTANSGGIQAATLAATLGTVRADARAITVGTATSGGTMDLTASTGTLALGTGTASGIATLTKQAGAVGTDGDDLRVTSFTGATDVNLVSNTSVRAGTVTATTGNVGITATGGDVSGLLTGTFERLPLVTTGASLSGNYGLAGISATTGNISIMATNGGVQLAGLSAGGSYTVSGLAVSGGTANPAGALSVTATSGTLVLASATGSSVTLVKQGGTIGTDGDELRVATVTSPGLVDLSSATHIRSNSVTSTAGNVVLAATAGDLTGINTGAFSLLPTVQAGGGLGTPFSSNYGQVGLTSTAGSVNFSAGNAAQIGTVSAFTSITGAAGGLSVDTATAGTTLSLTANSGTLSLRTGTAGAGATLIKNGGSVLVDGDELRVGNIVGQTGVTLTSNTSIRAGTARAINGNLSATTTLGDITGLLTGAFESPVPLVSLTDRLTTNYGFAALEATAGNVVANAGNAVQAGTTSGGLTDIDGRAVALNSAIAGTSLDVTATTGTLSLLTGTAGTTALFTKQAGAVLTPGDELRVTSFVAGGNVTAISNTHVRTNSLTANNGNVSVTATTGDVSGLATGAFERLATVTTGTRLSANYGQTTITANGATGNASISAAQGGIQAAAITGALDASATALAMAVDSAQAGRDLSLTATAGTLLVGNASAVDGTLLLTKQGGSAAVDGDDLRVTSAVQGPLVIGVANLGLGLGITSSTSIRAGTVLARNGSLTATATNGDISGFKTGSFERLPLVSTGSVLSTNYGGASFQSTRLGVLVTAAGGGVQLAGTTSGQNLVQVEGLAVAADVLDAIGLSTLVVRANQGTLHVNDARGRIVTLSKLGGALVSEGDELRAVLASTADGLLTVSSSTSARLGSLTASGTLNSGIAITAGGDITGLRTGAFEAAIPIVTTGARFSNNYGLANLSSTVNGITFTAGGAAQFGTIGTTALTGTARGITLNTLTTSQPSSLTATTGTLFVGDITATSSVTLTKQGGLATTAGDELRVGTATASGALTLTSSTAIRAGTLSSTASTTSLTTTGGDITGLAGASTGTSDAGFGRVVISGATGVAGTAAGLIQAGSVASSGGAIGLTAGAATADGAIDVSSLNTPGVATLRATAIAPLSAPTRDGDIRLGTATVGGLVLDNTVNGGTSGLVEVTGAVVASGDISARSATTAGMLGAVTAGANYTVAAFGNVVLGGSAATAQSAGGAISISSSNASITQGSGALTLTANADGVGAEAMLVSGFINTALANTALVGGNGGRQSAITLQASTGSTAVNTVSSGSLASTSATGFTAGGAITAGSAGIAANALTGPATVDIVVSNGGITATTITATDAGHDIHLGASGAIATGALTAARSVRIDGGIPAAAAASFTAPSVTATTGSLDLRAGSANISGTATSGTTMTMTTTGAMTLGSASSGGAMGLTAAALNAGSLNSSSTMAVTAGTMTVTGATTSSGAMNLTTTGAMTLAGVNSGSTLTIAAGTLDATSLASATTTSVTASDIDVTGLASSGGAMTLAAGSGPIVLGSATSGAGLTASGGSITVSGSTTVTGTANLTATTGAISLAGVNAGQLIANARSAFTTSGAIAAGNSSLPADAVAGPATVDIVVTNGGITTQAITASGAGHDIHLGASGAIATGALTAARSVRIDGGTPAVAATSFAAPSVTATSGSLDLRAGTANVTGAATSGGAMTLITSGATTLGSASAGGNLTANAAALTVTGAANSTGGVTITTSGATQLGSTSASGALAITASNVNVGGAANSTGSTVAITAGSGPVQLGSTSSSGAMTVSGGAITVTGAANSGSTMAFDATGTTLNLGSATASGAVTLAARTRVTLGAVSSSGSTVTLTAADADINGAVTASRITVVNRGAAGNDFRLGGGAAGTGGFALDAAEVNRLGAATVVFDAGTGAGETRQDVSIGTLDLTNAAVRTLEVQSLQRIDLTGNFTRGSGSGLTAMRLGGSATASDRASVLRTAAQPNGSGGMISIGSATVELRANTIAAGFDTGFLDQLGVIEGGVPSGVTAWTAADMVSNGASSLYNSAAFTGLIYQPRSDGTLQQHVTAGSMTVRYANFALFQNTGIIGANEGVALGTAASPAIPAISIFGPNPPDGGPFAVFGKLNGISDTQTALLGPAVISVNGVDRTTARINGCLIGSGAGCLTTLTLTPSLSNIDPVRANIFFPNTDFILPFDPLVGTNNDSLFGDVGTFGLGDIPLAPIECEEGDKSSACSQQQEGAK